MAKMIVAAAFVGALLIVNSSAQSPFGQSPSSSSNSAQPPSSASNPGSGTGYPTAPPMSSGSSSSLPSGNGVTPPSPLNSTEHSIHEAEVSTSTIVPILFGGNSSLHHGNLSMTTPSAEKHTGHEHTSHATTIAVGSSLLLVLVAPMF